MAEDEPELWASTSGGGLETPVLVALISAVAALLVALANIAWQRVQTRQSRIEQEGRDRQAQQDHEALERLKEEIEARKAQRDARLEYEYEAKKELYRSAEPLLFQLHELAQQAWFRSQSLARAARSGHLNLRDSWLAGDSYYMLSTIYTILAVLAAFRLLQRRLTFLDIGLDHSIGERYVIGRALYWLFTDHHDLAKKFEPSYPDYDPWGRDAAALREQWPERYWPQGIPGQRLDGIVDAVIYDPGTDTARVMSFSEFRRRYEELKAAGELDNHDLAWMLFIFERFHPKTRPVLWRILVTQAYLCELLVKARPTTAPALANAAEFDLMSEAGRKDLDWRQMPDEAKDEEVLVVPFNVAQRYVMSRLPGVTVRRTLPEPRA